MSWDEAFWNAGMDLVFPRIDASVSLRSAFEWTKVTGMEGAGRHWRRTPKRAQALRL